MRGLIKLNSKGFTIVELLIVVVVIAILAAITIVSYNGITTQANKSKVESDLTTLEKAITIARNNESKKLSEITGSGYTRSACSTHPAGTNLASLPKTDACWVAYLSALDKISTASGIDIRNLTDPWGRPYGIDENEGESGSCTRKDSIAAYNVPFDGSTMTNRYVEVSGFTPCI